MGVDVILTNHYNKIAQIAKKQGNMASINYLYETHLHTAPASKCAKETVREALEFYKSLGYAGVFITNHFIDGNIGCERSLSYAEQVEFYFADYEEGVRLGKEIGSSVFCGVESSYKGTDFLIYGLDKAWYLAHPEILTLKRTEVLTLMQEAGALIIQAHPYREASYIDHIRLFPRHVHGVEVCNASQRDFYNEMAEHYAKAYGLIPFAGSDKHNATHAGRLCGMQSAVEITDVQDFITRLKNGELTVFCRDLEE